MKKVLFMISVATFTLMGCTNESSEYVGEGSSIQNKEIAFSPLAQPLTRGVIKTGVFPTGNTMEVAAYKAAPASAASYFAKMTFSYNTTDYVWKGSTPQYWPLSPITLNFFAVSGNGLTNSHVTIDTDLDPTTVSYTSANSYSKDSQVDILYSSQRASVTKSGNALTIPATVNMTFNHALALINFQIKGSEAIKIKKIELNGARYTGTLTLNSANTTSATDAMSTRVDWAPDAVVNNVKVPNIGNESSPVALTGSYVPENPTTKAETDTWACLMIIPSTQTATVTDYGFTSFVITYLIGNDATEYTYEYAPAGWTSGEPPTANLTSVQAGYKYTYQITMNLHEITITPTVTEWNNTDNAVTIPPTT